MDFFPAGHPLHKALTERDYTDPTAVQEAVLEPGAMGRDLLVSAQTGSGKTVAYGLAIADTLLGDAFVLEQLPLGARPQQQPQNNREAPKLARGQNNPPPPRPGTQTEPGSSVRPKGRGAR